METLGFRSAVCRETFVSACQLTAEQLPLSASNTRKHDTAKSSALATFLRFFTNGQPSESTCNVLIGSSAARA